MLGARGLTQPSPTLPVDQRMASYRYMPAHQSNGQQMAQTVWSRPHLAAPAATSKALEYFRPQAKFVRPDTDEPASDLLAAFVSRSGGTTSVADKPQFRTALEQVSYETNSSRMYRRETKPRVFGLLDRAVKMFQK